VTVVFAGGRLGGSLGPGPLFWSTVCAVSTMVEESVVAVSERSGESLAGIPLLIRVRFDAASVK
jgi:hypothetical protein